ncbi:type II secretion system F family protein [Georgenia sp. Z1344]|uniref:type II secretion system F family protein n=1 Tax=Georgenia sp. Z1344 TaxID=3416706 RepID=UPI003CF99B6F
MGVVAGLLLGAGLCLVWFSFFEPAERTSRDARWTDHIQDALTRSGSPSVSPASFLAVSTVLGLAVLVVVLALTAAAPVAVAFGLIAAVVPWLVVTSRARTRTTRLREVWPDVIDGLVSAVRAGRSLPEAVGTLAERGPESVRPEFRRFVADHRATGNLVVSLDRLKARLADPVADRIVEALKLTREVGGSDLTRLLRALAHMLREDQRTRGELEARQSWTVNGARLAVAAPWAVLAVLAGRPEAAAAYGTTTGAVVLGIGAGTSALAYWLMLRLGRLPAEARVLR